MATSLVKENLIGFTIPDDMLEDIKTKMKFVMENPNTFDLKRPGEFSSVTL